MGLFSRNKQDIPATTRASRPGSDVTTAVHSPALSILENEKVEPAQVTINPSRSQSQGEDAGTALEQKIEGIENDEEALENDADIEYPKGMKLTLITIALCLSVFCMALDNTIISTAIPRITDEFKSINDVGWYGSAYLLTTCAFQLFFGKLYTFLSVKWVYIVAIVIFEVGSAVCGAAPSSTALIIGRAVAGLGSAGIFSGAVLIVSNTVPLKTRPSYMGMIGAMYGISSILGPILGGVFTDKWTWRGCFYVNLPIGAVTLLFITFFYKPTAQAQAQSLATGWKARVNQFDIFGTIVFLPMIVCLLLALQWGGSKYSWHNGKIIALLVVFAVLLLIFCAIQVWKKDNATVPLRVLKQRTVAAGALFGASLGAAFFIFIYFLPIWFQAIKGTDAVGSGIDNIPTVLSLVVFSMISGIAVTKFGYYTPFCIASSILLSIGAGLLTTLKPNTGSGMWIGYQVIFGAGCGFGMQQTLVAVQTVLPRRDIPIGTAIMMFSQTLGGALFISVAQNVFTNSLLKNLKKVVPDLSPVLVLATGATSLKTVIPPQYLSGVQLAYNASIINTFYVAVALAVLSIFGAVCFEWKSVKGKKIEMAAA